MKSEEDNVTINMDIDDDYYIFGSLAMNMLTFYIDIYIYRKTKLYYMIMCLRLKLIPGHDVCVQFTLSKGIPLHAPPWQERLLVDSPTPHVFEQVVHCDHCVQVP